MNLGKRCTAEALGTFWLVFGGCGSAVLAAKFMSDANNVPINLGIGLVGVSFAFGLTVLTMAYAIGHISGCHLNPAVSVGLMIAKRFPSKDLVPYIIAQVIGGLLGAYTLYYIAQGNPGFSLVESGFACNGYDNHSPGNYSMASAFVAEVVLTFFFLFIILPCMRGVGEKAPQRPWEAAEGLEWEVPSPAPFHTFENPPKLNADATRIVA